MPKLLNTKDLTQLTTDELCVRKGLFLHCCDTKEQYNRWFGDIDDDQEICSKDDPRWNSQYQTTVEQLSLRKQEEREPLWVILANVVKERPFGPGGIEKKKGTFHFNAGAKVHIVDSYWGLGCETVTVIGRRRGAGIWMKLDMPSKFLENFRIKQIYNPSVINGCIMHFEGRDRCWSKDKCDNALKLFQQHRDKLYQEVTPRGLIISESMIDASVIKDDGILVDVFLKDGRVVRNQAIFGRQFQAIQNFSIEDISVITPISHNQSMSLDE